jgi:hypothetical protein
VLQAGDADAAEAERAEEVGDNADEGRDDAHWKTPFRVVCGA